MNSLQVSEQFGGAPFDELTDHGSKGIGEILDIYDSKRWFEEASTAEITELCAPTISLKDASSDRLFWISPYLNDGELRFVNEYRYRLASRGILSRIMRKTHESPQTRELNTNEARRALQLFSEDRHEELLQLVCSA